MSGCSCQQTAQSLGQQKRLLGLLLALNGAMFVIEGGLGLLAQSAALLADSLDMLADAAVYGIALVAVGRSTRLKTTAARISGAGQLLLALLVLAEVIRRTLHGSEPQSLLIMATGTLALVVNIICMALLYRHRKGEIHLRASWLFSANDVLANLGVITGGLLVSLTGTPWPDLVIGTAIALLVARTGVKILRDASRAVEAPL